MRSDSATSSSDPILATLYKVQVHFVTFRQLTGVDDPRELTLDRIRRTGERIIRADQIVRSKHEGQDITCLAWTVGAFWLLPEGVNEYIEAIQQSDSITNGFSPQPVWRLTMSEMLDQHLGNLRQLVLWVSYDLMSIDALKEKMPRDHVTLKNEFARCERVVLDLIQELSQERERFSKVLSDEVELYERAIMTERMIKSGELTETALGYTLENLKQAQQRIHELCRRELAIYEQVLNLTRGRMQQGLREGERAHLSRTSRWDYAFSRFDDPPEGLMGRASLVTFERRRLASLVSAREEELGPSKEGETLLAESKTLDEARKTPRARPVERVKEAKKKLIRRVSQIKRPKGT